MSDTSLCDITQRHCLPCEGGVAPLDDAGVAKLLPTLPGWQRAGDGIEKAYRFANHHEVMAFLNALAWISHQENHHPDIRFGYRDVTVAYTTHAIGGLSDNDFICAARVDALLG